MTTLDEENTYVDPATVSFWSTGLRYGLIGGVISVIYALIGILTGLSNPGGGFMKLMVFGLIALVITIVVIVFTIKKHRDEDLGGYISIGRAIIVGLVASVVMVLISTVFNYIYMNFIDPGYIDTVIEGMEEMMANFGLPEEDLEKAIEDTRDSLAPSKMFTTGILKGAAFGGFISIIVGAIMKKNPPNA